MPSAERIKTERSIAINPYESCDLQPNSVISFTWQLFFGSRLCFYDSAGERTAYAGRHADDAPRRVQRGSIVLPHSRRGRPDRREMGVPDPPRRAEWPSALRGI